MKSYPTLSAYSSAKAALVLQTKSLAQELSTQKITVNIIQPGPVDTAMLHQVLDPDQVEALRKTMPLQKIGVPMDIIAAVVYLASDLASWITGSVFTIDGGASLDSDQLINMQSVEDLLNHLNLEQYIQTFQDA